MPNFHAKFVVTFRMDLGNAFATRGAARQFAERLARTITAEDLGFGAAVKDHEARVADVLESE